MTRLILLVRPPLWCVKKILDSGYSHNGKAVIGSSIHKKKVSPPPPLSETLKMIPGDSCMGYLWCRVSWSNRLGLEEV